MWMDGKWLERAERDAKIAEYQALLDEVEGVPLNELTDDELEEIEETIDVLEQMERINRCEFDLLAFSLEYFSNACNPENSGNWDGFDITDIDQAPEFHKEIAVIMDDVAENEPNAKVAVAAPRSHAKSTYLSKAFPLREVAYRRRKYVITISETPTVASGNLEWISSQLKYNVKLRKDFGPLLSQKPHENIRDNGSEFIAWEPQQDGPPNMIAKMEAASANQALRGRNWNANRPDLIVCDDLEDIKSNASTPEQRDKMRSWFAQTVMPLGDPKGLKTAIVYMGTTVHHEALLVNVMTKRSDFKSRRYQAIIDYPERMDLWEECRKIYTDHNNVNKAADARAFYNEHRAEMDAGCRVLWPEAQPIWKLMTWKWDNGTKAFNTEYMNNPVDEDSQIFVLDDMTYWNGGPLDQYLTRYPRPTDAFDVYFGIDLAMGKVRGDYSAIAVLARSKMTGTRFVVDVYLERVKPDQFIKDIVQYTLKYQPEAIAVEAQAAQEFFADMLRRELTAAGYPAYTRIRDIKQRQRKELRIEALQPEVESGRLQFSTQHTLLLEQFEMFPNATHDDGPDAVEMAYSISESGVTKLQDKPAWM